ncbi:MAG: hypothetical protein WBG70_10320 [Spirulinaceae cyanobacterium]
MAIVLQGLFDAPYLLVMGGILLIRLCKWSRGIPRFSLNRDNLFICLAGLALVFIFLLPYAISTSTFGPTISGEEAKLLPAFQEGGRNSFFNDSFWTFWFVAHRSLFIALPLRPVIMYAGFLLPIILLNIVLM